jgi:hypothetical protein
MNSCSKYKVVAQCNPRQVQASGSKELLSVDVRDGVPVLQCNSLCKPGINMLYGFLNLVGENNITVYITK